MEAVVAGTAMIPPAAVLFALMSAASLKSLEKKPSGNPETSSNPFDSAAPAAAAASANLARVGVSSPRLPAALEAPAAPAAPAPEAEAEAPAAPAPEAEAPAAPAPEAEAEAPAAPAPEAEVEAAAPAPSGAPAASLVQQQSFWTAVIYGLENKHRRLDAAITTGTKNPELLTMIYNGLPLLVQVIQIAKEKAVNDDIQTYMGDFLGREQRAQKRGGRTTRRQRGGARTTDLETFTQMILNRIIAESANDKNIASQATDAFTELVKYENLSKNNDKIDKYLGGVFDQFMKIKKDGKTNVAVVLFDTITPKAGSEFKINPRLLNRTNWLGSQNKLKADPRVVAALREKAAAKAEAAAEAETRAANIAAVNQEGDKADSAEVAAEALSKAQEAAREAEKSAERRKVLTTPTAEELRNQAAEEQSRNKAAAAEERAARVNAADNQDEVRMNKLDKRAENAAARAAAEVRAAKAAKSAKLLARAPHILRRRQGGKRRTLRKSTFRRHRKH